MDLFDQKTPKVVPLAERMRPHTIDAFVGQEHLVGPKKVLRNFFVSLHSKPRLQDFASTVALLSWFAIAD